MQCLFFVSALLLLFRTGDAGRVVPRPTSFKLSSNPLALLHRVGQRQACAQCLARCRAAGVALNATTASAADGNATTNANTTAPAPAPANASAPAACNCPCAAPSPAPAPAGNASNATALAGRHGSKPEDDYTPALEGAVVPPFGDLSAEPVASAQSLVPPEKLEKIVSVDCLTKTLENPEYVCVEHHYVDGAPNTTAEVAALGPVAAVSDAHVEKMQTLLAKVEDAAVDAKAEAAKAEKFFKDAENLSAEMGSKKPAAAAPAPAPAPAGNASNVPAPAPAPAGNASNATAPAPTPAGNTSFFVSRSHRSHREVTSTVIVPGKKIFPVFLNTKRPA